MENDLDITPLVRAVWLRRRLVVQGTAATTFLALLVSLLLPNIYRSEGFFQAKMTGSVYKTTAAALADPDRFCRFLSDRKRLTENEQKDLCKSVVGTQKIAKAVAPFFEGASTDSKGSSEDTGNPNLLGLKIAWENVSPIRAQKIVISLAEFFRDALLYDSLHDYIGSRFSEAAESLRTLKTVLIQNNFEEQQLLRKKNDLQAIRKQYPSVPLEIKQVFSANARDSYQYLSPASEVVKADVAIWDLRRERLKLLRDQDATELKYDFFSNANELLKKDPASGESLFRQFIELENHYFKDKDLAKDTVQEFFATLPKDIDTLSKTILYDVNINQMYYVSGPSLPTRKISPRRSLIILLTLFISLAIFSGVAVTLDWWETNWRQINSASQIGNLQQPASNSSVDVRTKPSYPVHI